MSDGSHPKGRLESVDRCGVIALEHLINMFYDSLDVGTAIGGHYQQYNKNQNVRKDLLERTVLSNWFKVLPEIPVHRQEKYSRVRRWKNACSIASTTPLELYPAQNRPGLLFHG
jgi:hypothetical protein